MSPRGVSSYMLLPSPLCHSQRQPATQYLPSIYPSCRLRIPRRKTPSRPKVPRYGAVSSSPPPLALPSVLYGSPSPTRRHRPSWQAARGPDPSIPCQHVPTDPEGLLAGSCRPLCPQAASFTARATPLRPRPCPSTRHSSWSLWIRDGEMVFNSVNTGPC